MSARLISIIGPPASGKTTLATWLAGTLPGRLVREDYAGNPFLEDAWLGRREVALAAQLYFLFSRTGQLNRATWPASGLVISDYGFCQDGVYAARNLSGEDLGVYRRLARDAAGIVQPPDVVIVLGGSERVLLERIAARGRRHEQSFTPELLASLSEAYREIATTLGCPVLNVDAENANLLEDSQRRKVLADVHRALGVKG